MKLRLWGLELHFSFWFFAVVIAFALLTEIHLLAIYFILPIVVHETGHVLCMLLLRVPIKAVSFTAYSVDITKGNAFTGYGREIAVSLGGVAANLLFSAGLYLFAFPSLRTMLMVSTNLAVAAFNLLPIGNLDGGEVLHLALSYFGGVQTADKVSKLFSFLVLVPLFAFALFLLFRGIANFSILLVCIYLICVVLYRD